MKLIIQIPCFNEEQNLAITLNELPRKLKGIDKIEWLVINDGSTDKTVDVAKENGVDHIINFSHNKGLAKAFMGGLIESLRLGADIILNLDADNQYCAEDIPRLIEPILKGEAEIVIGERPISQTAHFSHTKKILQNIGSSVVRLLSNTQVPDAPSGFRAISRDAAFQINVFNDYTYTLEMIIEAGQKGIPIKSVPVRTNEPLRESRLITSISKYIAYSALTIIRSFITYKPLRFFFILGSILITSALLVGIRWLLLFLGGPQGSSIPSLILTAILLILGVQLIIFGLIADLMSVNRKLLEEIQLNIRKNSTNCNID
jgi:glycosyltransferase involved in cell wall biosynthesis